MIKKIESIKDLVLDPENANAGTVRGMALIDSSIAQDGVGRGVAADRNGILFAGNKTVQAAVEKGIEIIPVHTDGNQLVVTIRDDIDYTEAPERFKRLAIADNRSGEVGLSWDNAVLEKLADEIDLSQFWTTEELAEQLEKIEGIQTPEREYTEDLEIHYHECPECGHKWPK